MAQVYSANAVGYVNLSISPGFAIIANPLNGTNNHLNTILPLPDTADGTIIYRFKPASQNYGDAITFYALGGGQPGQWASADLNEDYTVNPGEGFFIQTPPGVTLNVTFVGEVPQGQLANPVLGGNNYSILSSQVPQALPLGYVGSAGTLEFPAADGDIVYIFDAAVQNYKQAFTFYGPPNNAWASENPDDPGVAGPTIPVGTGFFVQKTGSNTSWNRNFSVN
jgi:hypothetical protein